MKKKKISNIENLFEINAFNEFIENHEFRTLTNDEILKATEEFYKNFLYKKNIEKNFISNMKCNFSYYFSSSKYSDNYISIQKNYLL